MIGTAFLNVFYGRNEADSFTAQLFRLIAKADMPNKARLAVGFPKEIALYLWWVSQPEKLDEASVLKKAAELEARP